MTCPKGLSRAARPPALFLMPEKPRSPDLPSVLSASSSFKFVPPLALGEQDPRSNIPLESATWTSLHVPSSH